MSSMSNLTADEQINEVYRQKKLNLVEVFGLLPVEHRPKHVRYNHPSKRWIMAGMFVGYELIELVVEGAAERWLIGLGCTVIRSPNGQQYNWIDEDYIKRSAETLNEAMRIGRWIMGRDEKINDEEKTPSVGCADTSPGGPGEAEEKTCFAEDGQSMAPGEVPKGLKVGEEKREKTPSVGCADTSPGGPGEEK